MSVLPSATMPATLGPAPTPVPAAPGSPAQAASAQSPSAQHPSGQFPSALGVGDALSFDTHVGAALQKPEGVRARNPSPAGSHSGNQSVSQSLPGGRSAGEAGDETRANDMTETERPDQDIARGTGDGAAPPKTPLVATADAARSTTPRPATARDLQAPPPQLAKANARSAARRESDRTDPADPALQTTIMAAGVPQAGPQELEAGRALPAAAAETSVVDRAKATRHGQEAHGCGDGGVPATAQRDASQTRSSHNPDDLAGSSIHHPASSPQENPAPTAAPPRSGAMTAASEAGQAVQEQMATGAALPIPDGDAPQHAGIGRRGPSAQVAAPLVRLASAVDGSSHVQVSMHPRDLGNVEIHLDRRADGSVSVTVAASEPSTLRSLIADQAHLHAALDAASVPGADRHVTFQLSAQPTDQGSLSGAGSGGGGGAQDGAAGSHGGDRDDRGSRQARGEESPAGGGGPTANAALADDRAPMPAFLAARRGSYRPAINITA